MLLLLWLLFAYNSYKYARTVPISIACYWLMPLKSSKNCFYFFFYRLSIVEYRILIIDRTNHHSTVNCHKLFFFFINIIIFICYIYIYFFVFLICSLQMRVMKIHLLCIDVSIFSDLIFFYLLVW